MAGKTQLSGKIVTCQWLRAQHFQALNLIDSQVCNGGFFTSHIHRGKGFASILARSYLHYAPKLGYKASVFNLVYANNQASVR